MVLNQDESEESTKLELKVKDLPPYDGILTLISTKYLSYDLQLLKLRELLSFPSRLESTTQVVAVGFDLFYTRTPVESSFDLLQENFNYPLLFGFIAVLALALFLLRSYVTQMQAKNKFLLS
mmetsp:Transcript_34527/g.25621  ORF Transcript_34527/g.25621 Transcript_34527/m.25621 type:complete len:122 (-) Transcript_34527:32-397(-)